MNQDLELLKHWVLDEGKFVTSVYLLRNTDLDVTQVEKLLNTFLEENVANDKVSATYFVLGELIGESDGILRKKSVICKKEDLDTCKSKFSSIDACIIYSVQAKPIEEFQVLFNASWLDTRTYMSPDKEKTLVKNSSAIINYQKWKESHRDDEYRMEQASARVLFNDKIKSETKSKENEENSRKIDQLFKKSVKMTPKKEESNSSSANKHSSFKSPSSERKKSKRKSIVESDDNDIIDCNMAASLSLSASKKKSVPVELKLDNDDLFCTDSGSEKGDDPFADVDELEEMEKAKEVIAKKSEKQNGSVSAVCQGGVGKKTVGGAAAQKKRGKRVVLIGRHSSDEEENNSDAGDEKMEIADTSLLPESIIDKLWQKGATTSGVVKQEERKVTESYVDEDGFLVTQTVMKPIAKANGGSEENISSNGTTAVAAANKSNKKEVKSETVYSEMTETKPQVLKPSNGGKSVTAASKKKGANSAKQPAAGQKTISSFFAKK